MTIKEKVIIFLMIMRTMAMVSMQCEAMLMITDKTIKKIIIFIMLNMTLMMMMMMMMTTTMITIPVQC